ncbi:22217_t:CDS:2 [Entrophospora sp. SA101]|nr:22217_t:CDS:2 [Entrophospora sp. SA101]
MLHADVQYVHLQCDSGRGLELVSTEIGETMEHVKFVLPNAPMRSITINRGMIMRGWFDLTTLSLDEMVDEDGVMESISQNEIDSGIASNRIVVGGISQGVTIALGAGISSEYPLAGMFGFSGFLRIQEKIIQMSTQANKNTPIFMTHGDSDELVDYQYGKQSSEFLKKNGQVGVKDGKFCCAEKIQLKFQADYIVELTGILTKLLLI